MTALPQSSQRLKVLRAIDKLDRLGAEAVFLLLTNGRNDESGDFTEGAGLSLWQAGFIMLAVGCKVEVLCHRPDEGTAIVCIHDRKD